ncbi:NosD domain-containing protein [Alteromonas oceanisediminis]|uniref:NosD domain-containing protein n=1 Tax=Alteromonas oceanisediminis TaxID=2836180 RepID=UPI001BDAABAD|nr:right-handed parallel beta-helix repeat-containing protein [Alteromonas oceanisediminis]MBT0585622.1 right-handed parallel beta-helix repeat-containing protein [Alteromonas oceanisediminis]
MMNKLCLATLCLLYLFSHPLSLATEVTLMSGVNTAQPDLPDLSRYTETALRQRANKITIQGSVRVAELSEFREQTRIFYSDKFAQLTRLQGSLPRVIVIENGRTSMALVSEVAQEYVQISNQDTYTVSVPIIISHGASLHVSSGETLRLSAASGSFVFNSGILSVDNAEVIGWQPSTQSIASFSGNAASFRPFIMTYSGGELYFNKSRFASLGYDAPSAFGISFKSVSETGLIRAEEKQRAALKNPPTGWIIDSHFDDLYFGFYSYEAENIVLLRNSYTNNVVYGIDPHDYSKNLIIAHNRVSGTQKLHGIIGSRYVSDSYIIYNNVSGSGRSGIMLDRQSNNNIVAYNTSSHNGGDGITIYESQNNTVIGNQVYRNQDHGIRLRNSTETVIQSNIILGNRGSGVYFHTQDLAEQTYRDLTRDPYEQKTGGSIIGGLIAGNQTGGIFAENFDSIILSELRIEQNGNAKQQFRGDLAAVEAEVTIKLWQHGDAVKVTRDAK